MIAVTAWGSYCSMMHRTAAAFVPSSCPARAFRELFWRISDMQETGNNERWQAKNNKFMGPGTHR